MFCPVHCREGHGPGRVEGGQDGSHRPASHRHRTEYRSTEHGKCQSSRVPSMEALGVVTRWAARWPWSSGRRRAPSPPARGLTTLFENTDRSNIIEDSPRPIEVRGPTVTNTPSVHPCRDQRSVVVGRRRGRSGRSPLLRRFRPPSFGEKGSPFRRPPIFHDLGGHYYGEKKER